MSRTTGPTGDPRPDPLAPDHRHLLEHVSGIAPAVIAARGYRTVARHAELQRLGFGRGQCPAPALLIPVHDLGGDVVLYQARPDLPRVNRDGRVARYEVPRGSRLAVDAPPTARGRILDPLEPLVVVLGVRSADAAASRGVAAVALLHPWGWRHQDAFWGRIPLAGRPVILAWNSPALADPEAGRAAVEFERFLRTRGANVDVFAVPAAPDGGARGVDDWLAAGHALGDLPRLESRPGPQVPDGHTDPAGHPYRRTDRGLVMDVPGRGGEVTARPLTNFDARIAAEVVVTDGAEERRELEVEATVAGKPVTATVDAEEFAPMGWVVPRLGPMAVLAAGAEAREHARAAIQLISGRIPTVTAYTHLGWVRVGASDLFLFADGVLGADFAAHWGAGPDGRPAPKVSRFPVIGHPGPGGPPHTPDEVIHTIRVRAPDPLRPFRLPAPPAGDELRQAVRDSLELVTVAQDAVTLPLYAAVWRAVLGDASFSVALDGGTGNGKSTLVALFQQHLGPAMDHENLPAGWDSTANYLEAVCFAAKDQFLVIDDWVARGSRADVDRANRDADRLFRGQGNRSGRGRCAADGTPRPARHSRCLPVCTQEEAPVGHSLNARVLRLDVGKADVLAPANLPRLNRLQQLAAAGQFARATAGFIAHLAADLPGHRAEFRAQFLELRELFRADGRHPRTAAVAAELTAGFDAYLFFALAVGAIDEEEYNDYWERIHAALREKIDDQHRHLAAQDPVTQFLNCLHAAIAGGHCHLANRRGEAPDARPEAWGWREESVFVARSPLPATLRDDPPEPEPPPGADEVTERSRWRPRGTRVGWVIEERAYLLGEKALGEAQKVARDMEHRLAIQYQSLGRALFDAGLVVERDRSRGRFTKRLNAEGGRHNTLCLDAHALVRREFHSAEFVEDDYDGPDPTPELLGDGGADGLTA